MWWVYAAANAVFLSIANVLVKLSSGKVNPILGAAVTLASAALVVFGLSWLIPGISAQAQAYWLPALIGIFSGIGMASWFLLLSSGVAVSSGGIVAILGVIVLTALFGVIFLGEKLSLIKIIGLVLGLIAAGLLAL